MATLPVLLRALVAAIAAGSLALEQSGTLPTGTAAALGTVLGALAGLYHPTPSK